MKCGKEMFLAFIVALGFFGCVFFLLFKEFPANNKDLLVSLLGVLTTIFTLIMNYFFGNSSSSKAKDETIAAVANKPPQEGVVTITTKENNNVNQKINPE